MASENCVEMLHWLRQNSTSLDMDSIYAMLDGKPYDIKQHTGQKLPTDMGQQNFNASDILSAKEPVNLDNIPIDMFIKENINPVSSSTDDLMTYVCSFCEKQYKREKFLVKHMQKCYSNYVRKLSNPLKSRRKMKSSCYYGDPIPTSRCILSQIQEYSFKMKGFRCQNLQEVPNHIQQHPVRPASYQIQQSPLQNQNQQFIIPTQQFSAPKCQFPVSAQKFPIQTYQLSFDNKQFSVPQHLSPGSPAQVTQPSAAPLQSPSQALQSPHQTVPHRAQTLQSPVQILSSPTQTLQSSGQTVKYPSNNQIQPSPAQIHQFPAQAHPYFAPAQYPARIESSPAQIDPSLARMQRLHAQIKQQLSNQNEQRRIPDEHSINISSDEIEACLNEIQQSSGEIEKLPEPIQQHLSSQGQQACVPVEKELYSSVAELQEAESFLQLDFEDLLD